jgi:hypothetical protein
VYKVHRHPPQLAPTRASACSRLVARVQFCSGLFPCPPFLYHQPCPFWSRPLECHHPSRPGLCHAMSLRKGKHPPCLARDVLAVLLCLCECDNTGNGRLQPGAPGGAGAGAGGGGFFSPAPGEIQGKASPSAKVSPSFDSSPCYLSLPFCSPGSYDVCVMHARRNDAAKHSAMHSARRSAVAIAERSRFPTLRWKPGTVACHSVSQIS